MKLIRIILFSFTFILFHSAHAQAPKYSNEFLSIGVGGRALAMGQAQVASVNDATAGFWNPAGLTMMKSNAQVTVMHSEYFAGIATYDYGSIATHPDSTHAMAFSIIRLGIDDIPNTLDLIDASGNINYDKIKSFAAADYGFFFSYAKKSKLPGLRYGGNVKVIHRIVGEFGKAWGFGLDLGAQYEKGKWLFGVMGKDVTSTYNAWNFNSDLLASTFAITDNVIPENSLELTLPKLILGAGYKTHIGKKISVLMELNADMSFDGQRNQVISSDPVSVDPHLGVEFGYDNFIFLRGGVNNIQEVKDFDLSKSTIYQPNMGLGVRLGNLTIEYALANVGSQETLYSNIFSLKLDIYKHKE